MANKKKPFQLPVTATVKLCHNDAKFLAHALDFDLVCVADSEEEATRKIELAIKTYIEYGLSNGWSDEIVFPAPDKDWNEIENATIRMGKSIGIMDGRMRVYCALTSHGVSGPRGLAVPA